MPPTDSFPEVPPVGARATLEHSFSQDDVEAFARLSGDTNPVHLQHEAAVAMGFEGTIVHGILAASLISRVLGTVLPGPGAIYLGQEMRFRKPIRPNRTVTVEVEVLGRRSDKPILELATVIRTEGEIAIEGRAVVLIRS